MAQPKGPTKTISQLGSGLRVGYVELGSFGGVTGSVRRQVHDGDTITVRSGLNFGVRFLNIDTPEISLPLPRRTGAPPAPSDRAPRFVSLANPAWTELLADPFAPVWPPFDPPLDPALEAHLRARTGPASALNHRRHAEEAEETLEGFVTGDLDALDQDEATFRFFLAFAYEVMDRNGRFLCWVNRYQPDGRAPSPRPPDYNQRMLAAGAATPYLIWPNLDPFAPTRQESAAIARAVPDPARLMALAADPRTPLGEARAAVRAARDAGLGLYGGPEPLLLRAFEVRFLARRRPPDRWVIDLRADDGLLHRPDAYHTIPFDEDRLFLPEEYVPLFKVHGWRTTD